MGSLTTPCLPRAFQNCSETWRSFTIPTWLHMTPHKKHNEHDHTCPTVSSQKLDQNGLAPSLPKSASGIPEVLDLCGWLPETCGETHHDAIKLSQLPEKMPVRKEYQQRIFVVNQHSSLQQVATVLFTNIFTYFNVPMRQAHSLQVCLCAARAVRCHGFIGPRKKLCINHGTYVKSKTKGSNETNIFFEKDVGTLTTSHKREH